MTKTNTLVYYKTKHEYLKNKKNVSNCISVSVSDSVFLFLVTATNGSERFSPNAL